MKAWLYSSTWGGLEKNLNLDHCARVPPPLRKDQVLTQVISACINPADYKVPEMVLVGKLITSMPASPGMDFCGRVMAVGDAVSEFHPGQFVYGCLDMPSQFGSLGEYVVSRKDQIAPVPAGVDLDQIAAVGIAGQTAYQSLVPYVSAGDKVFINAGSGGCGMFAIQMAKALGCHVTTTCSKRNVQFCKDLGADEVIDYTSEDVVKALKSHGQVYSHAIDHIGLPRNLYSESHRYLLPGKTFVQVGADWIGTFAGRLLRPRLLGGGKRNYSIFFYKNTHEHLVQLGEWVQQGKIKVTLDSVFEFEDAIKAIERQRSGRSRGKIVVHVSKKP